MNYLRYSSDEMFSSTELIRKSKMIFDKLNKKEIEKAVILRDGKPGFMLLDFATYEKIMKEFEKLNDKASKKVEEQFLSLEDIEVSNSEKKEKIALLEVEKTEAEEIVPQSAVENEYDNKEELEEPDSPEEEKVLFEESTLEDITNIDQMSSDEIDEVELMKALEEIDKFNLESEENINIEVSQAPQEDINELDNDFKIALDEIKEEEEKEEEPPLKEFWDN